MGVYRGSMCPPSLEVGMVSAEATIPTSGYRAREGFDDGVG